MLTVELLHKEGICIAFNPSGHALMTLIVSFLVINKVNVAYERYMQSRHALGRAFSSCRQLVQIALLYTEHLVPVDKTVSWRYETVTRIVNLLESTTQVIQDSRHVNYLSRNDDLQPYAADDDPLVHVEALRFHLFNINRIVQKETKETTKNISDDAEAITCLDLYERMRLTDPLNGFVKNYDNLLKCVSTPLPFQLVQMSRTFLFLWTFSIPLVMRGFVEEMYSAMAFVFFLTYGFIGLELVSTGLMNSFADDGCTRLDVNGMKEATIIGIQKDMRIFSNKNNKLHLYRPIVMATAASEDPKIYDTLPSH